MWTSSRNTQSTFYVSYTAHTYILSNVMSFMLNLTQQCLGDFISCVYIYGKCIDYVIVINPLNDENRNMVTGLL